MSKVWFLTELYYPEETSTGYLLTKIAEGLAEKHSVGVITGPATKAEEVTAAPDYEVHNGVEICRGWGTDFDKNNLFGRGVNWITRASSMGARALRIIDSDDVVVVVTNPPVLPYLTLFVKWVTGCRVVLLVHDVYPELLTATEVASEESTVVRVWHRLSRYLYNHVDRIVSLGRDMSRLLRRKVNDPDRIRRIWNWAENDLIEPMSREENPLRQKYDLQEKFVVLYAGNHGRTHGIEHLAEAARIFDEENSDIHFLFAGFGAKKEWLERYVSSHGLENVTSLGRYARSDQKEILSAGDLAVISYVPGMAGISVPSRMYNHMAAGTPILAIADDWSELNLVVQEEGTGWSAPPGNVDEIVSVIRHASSNIEVCQEKGERATNVAKTKYDFSTVNKRYEDLLSDMNGSNS
jgi:glycosyltransferase involved in cell wall biosynthesis